MGDKSFGMTLFMWIAGIAFIIVSIILIFFPISNFIEKLNIKNNGIEIAATITDKSYTYERYTNYENFRVIKSSTARYCVEYIVNNETYSYRFSSKLISYDTGDIVSVYCLENNPTEVYSAIERHYIVEGIVGTLICFVIGILCLKKYNIFEYKSEINVI